MTNDTVEGFVEDLMGELVKNARGFSQYADCKIWQTSVDLDAFKERLKATCHALLQSERGAIVADLEEMKMTENNSAFGTTRREGFNTALDHAINTIKQRVAKKKDYC